jgi:hypothetical protein
MQGKDLGEKIVLLKAILSCIGLKFQESYMPPAILIRGKKLTCSLLQSAGELVTRPSSGR